MSTQPRLAPTRRTLLRTAAWTAPAVSIAVAAPAFATSHLPVCNITGTRNGSNFYATITCSNGTISSVQIGTRPAIFNGVSYRAQLSGNAEATQMVTVVTDHGPITRAVTFTVTPGSGA